MFGWDDLKKTNIVTDDLVQCPVRDCKTFVKRQTNQRHGRKDEFLCIEHGIYISPTTFQYEKLYDNLLTRERSDLRLLGNVFKVKTESRLRAEKSEDAVVWNVFRTLEKQNKIPSILSSLPSRSNDLQAIYWGHHQKSELWDKLENARRHFSENRFGTEPDLILYSPNDNYFVFIEAKLDSSIKKKFNYTGNDLNKRKSRYSENEIYKDVFLDSFEDVAINSRFYELLRQWVLGNWISKTYGYTFYHICLVPDNQKIKAQEFQEHLQDEPKSKYSVITWGEIHSRITNQEISSYLEHKTLGYKKQKGIYTLQRLIH